MNDSKYPRLILLIIVSVAVIGGGSWLLISVMYHYFIVSPNLAEKGIETKSIAVEHYTLIIKVENKTYKCVAEDKVPERGCSVTVNPDDPSQCRQTSLVGKLSFSEIFKLLFAFSLLVGGSGELWSIWRKDWPAYIEWRKEVYGEGASNKEL